MSIHHGEILEKIIRQKNVNITKLAHDLGVSKTTMYNWFDTQYLSDDKWDRIGKAINYDFSKDIPTVANPYRGNPHELRKERIEEEFQFYGMSPSINVNVALNGDDRILQHTIMKLTKINEALKTV